MTRQIRAWPRRTRDGATLACPRARCPPLCRFPLRRLSAVALRPPLPSVTFEISPERGEAADISRKNHIERRLTCCAAVRPPKSTKAARSARFFQELEPAAQTHPESRDGCRCHPRSCAPPPLRFTRPRGARAQVCASSAHRGRVHCPPRACKQRRARTHRSRARPSPRREAWPCGLSRVAACVPALLALTPAGALLGFLSQARYCGRARSDRPVGGSRAPGRQAALPHCDQHNGLL